MNRNTVFSAVLLITLAAIIYRLLPPWVEPNFLLRLSKNEVAIEQIHQPRQISATRQVMIDRIELNKGNRFGHPKLGPLGWSENFFADLESRFTVTETGALPLFSRQRRRFSPQYRREAALSVSGRQTLSQTVLLSNPDRG